MQALKALSILALLLLAGCSDIARWTYDTALDAEKQRAGLEDRTRETANGIKWHYLASEGAADKPVVLLVHGFGADSSNWIRFANELEGDFRFIVPDLPGHGETTATTEMNYGIDKQAERLHNLMSDLGLPRYHVVGNSMGGAIAIEMAHQQPRNVLSLGLIDAAGLGETTEAFDQLLADGSNPLIPDTPEDFFTTLDWAMEQPPFMPDFLVRVMGERKADNAPVARKVWRDISGDGHLNLTGILPEIDKPTLILWGDKDRLLPVSSAHRFDELMPNSRKVILSGIGHVPMVESPEKTAVSFRPFWLEAARARREAAARTD